MSDQGTGILERLANAGLQKCFFRLSRLSGGEWRLGDISVSSGTLAEAVNLHEFKDPASAAAVYIHVKSDLPFLSLMCFETGDIGHISKCFMGESLPGTGCIPRVDEEMLLELGNIVLNAVINFLQNALRKSAIPSVPMLSTGDAGHIADSLGAYIEPLKNFRIITAPITVLRDSRASLGEVLTIIPLELAAALER